MPIDNYGVFKGRAISRRLATGSSPHYQIQLVDESGTHFRVAINVLSQTAPSEVMFYMKPFFIHPLTAIVKELSSGFNPLVSQPNSGALDFIRGNLFPPELMTPLPVDVLGPDNDLNEKLDQVLQRAMSDEDAIVYAFGQRWGPENKADNYFGFQPGNGIHDIHMNQGNVGRFKNDDGVWQDGGLIFEFPNQNQWTAVFLKFQSQSWHTDDHTGHTTVVNEPDPEEPTNPDPVHPQPTENLPDGLVRIVAAMVNSKESPEKEWVFLVNRSDRSLSLDGWQLADKQKAKMPLSGTFDPGAILKIDIVPPVALSNKGGIITVLNSNGLKVDGVSYTRGQANQPGWTIVF
jgi:uncharacterized protein YukJ